MAKAGIQRIAITDTVSGRGAWRFTKSQARQPAAIEIYREVFDGLLPGYEEMRCTSEEFTAGYDSQLGIDVILNFESGMTSTLQEKFLFTKFKTVTVEYMQDWRQEIPGDWFNLRAQYYFVGYDRINANTFQDWIILNWSVAQQLTTEGLIPWQLLYNKFDGARANAKFAKFDDFPARCVLARS